MSKMLALCGALALAAVGAADARPFTATDLARQERVSDPRISPDGRFVAYNVRSTDWEANRGVNALWVLERAQAGAPPHLIRDQEKSATSPRWSADGQWLYFLSSRSGSTQVWRAPASGAETRQVTSLPLDVAFYRLAPDGRARRSRPGRRRERPSRLRYALLQQGQGRRQGEGENDGSAL
jgi:acylaminoacyl-peptidase